MENVKLDLLYILRLSLHNSEVSDVLSPRCQTSGLNEDPAKWIWCSPGFPFEGWLLLLLAVKHPLISVADLSMKSTVCTIRKERKPCSLFPWIPFLSFPFFFPNPLWGLKVHALSPIIVHQRRAGEVPRLSAIATLVSSLHFRPPPPLSCSLSRLQAGSLAPGNLSTPLVSRGDGGSSPSLFLKKAT